jgi:predicted Zn-dependent protease
MKPLTTFDSALKSLEKRQFQEAKDILEELFKNNPEDVNV